MGSSFYAYCTAPIHNTNADGSLKEYIAPTSRTMCRKKRVGMAAVTKGRPLGFLFSWLKSHAFHHSADNHMSDAITSYADRVAARTELKAIVAAGRLFYYERPKGGAEPEKPLTV